jgi:hypothetical protein
MAIANSEKKMSRSAPKLVLSFNGFVSMTYADIFPMFESNDHRFINYTMHSRVIRKISNNFNGAKTVKK